MTISWESTYEQFKSAQRAHIKNTPTLAAKFVLYFILPPVIAVIAFAVLLHDSAVGKHIGESELIIPFALAVGSICGWISRALMLQKIYRNLWSPRDPSRTCNLSISETGIQSERTGIGKAQLEWNAFYRFTEHKKVILIYSTPTRWVNIPREVLSEDQHAELLRLLQTHVGSGSC
jgi:YcxB-like protein